MGAPYLDRMLLSAGTLRDMASLGPATDCALFLTSLADEIDDWRRYAAQAEHALDEIAADAQEDARRAEQRVSGRGRVPPAASPACAPERERSEIGGPSHSNSAGVVPLRPRLRLVPPCDTEVS